MKKLIIAALAMGMATSGFAGSLPSTTTTEYDPTFFAGFTWSFGAGSESAASGSNPFGFSLRYLSTNKPDTLAGAIGLTYYFDGSFGCDIGGAVNNGGASLTVGYDFCRSLPVIGLGAIKKPTTTTEIPD
ncbi:hypothetical protein [Cognatishimia sp.]|uniref:hypothetical protein n=1 Tax=Cognatishimia sp. TaxID=2211648 RepID=UPI003BAC1328